MTYSQIFDEIYSENKKKILSYITICLLFSVFAFGTGNMAFASSDFTTSEIVTTLGGSGGAMLAPLTLAQGCLSGIDAPSALFILCLASFTLDMIPEETLVNVGDTLGIENLEALSDYSFGILDYTAFKIVCIAWFVIAKLAKSNGVSQEISKIFGEFESALTVLINFLVIGSQFLANVPLGTTVQAAEANSHALNAVTYSFNALFCFISLLLVFVMYFFIRYLFYFIDIILLPICSIVPFSSFGVESVKTISVAGLFYLAIFHPVIFYTILSLILIVAIALFKTAYITVRYFKNIYIRPFFKKLRGYDTEIPLVSPKLPKKVKHYLSDFDVQFAIPVYILKKLSSEKSMRWHDRWWFVSAKDKQFLCKPSFMKNTCHHIDLHSNINHKIFIKKSLRFFEIFTLQGSEEPIGRTFRRVPKNLHFAFSKEYSFRYDIIKTITKYTDYTEYKKQIKTKQK